MTPTLFIAPPTLPREIALDLIRTDGGTQPRAELNDALIDEYADAMRAGATFPPVILYYDGASYWLTDGFHRLQAAARCGLAAISAEVKQGTLQEAQWYSYSVNQSHGLRRTNDDKRRAVEAALAHPFAGRYSSSQLAKHCGVSHTFVDNLRSILQRLQDTPERTVTRNGTSYTMDTANIGRNRVPSPRPARLQPPAFVPAVEAADETSDPEPTPSAEPAADFGDPSPIVAPPDPQPAAAPAITLPALGAVHDVGHLVKIIQGDAQQDYGLSGVHLVVTSPPYNVGIAYGAHDDTLSESAYRALLTTVFTNCYRALVTGGRIAVVVPFGVGRNPWLPLAARVADWLTAAGFTLRGQIVWDKSSTGNRTTWGSFRLPSDPCLRDTTEAIIVAHKETSRLELPVNVVLHDAKGAHTGWLADSDDFMTLAQDHWQIAPESAQRVGHPAPFPVALAERLIRFYAYPGCQVLDPFAGAGSVGIAAQRLGCRATLIDIDPAYCELAARRCRQELDHD